MGCAATSIAEWRLGIPPQEAQDRIRRAMWALGWLPQETKETGVIEALVGISLWSWGELVRVSITGNESSTLVATSTCRMCTQVMDWGKNAENIQRLYSALGEGGV